jgi:hypothetical protein
MLCLQAAVAADRIPKLGDYDIDEVSRYACSNSVP